MLRRLFILLMLSPLLCQAAGDGAQGRRSPVLNTLVKAFHWYERTFRDYDTLYLRPLEKQFAIVPNLNGWNDFHNIDLDGGYEIQLNSDPFLSVGANLYAFGFVLGYSVSIDDSQRDKSAQRLHFGVAMPLFDLGFYYTVNRAGTNISKLAAQGSTLHTDISLPGIDSRTFELGGTYYFNHHRYYQDASFVMDLRQVRSTGSFFVGAKYESHRLSIDFNEIAPRELDGTPYEWVDDLVLDMHSDNYLVTAGYGYNFVFPHGWILGLGDAVSVGVTRGCALPGATHTNLGIANKFRLGVGKNFGRVFTNLGCTIDVSRYPETDFTVYSAISTFTFNIGYKFNLY